MCFFCNVFFLGWADLLEVLSEECSLISIIGIVFMILFIMFVVLDLRDSIFLRFQHL